MIKFEKNQIVLHRSRGEFGIYICKIDEDTCSVLFNGNTTPQAVSTNWITAVEQNGVLKLLNDYTKNGYLDTTDYL